MNHLIVAFCLHQYFLYFFNGVKKFIYSVFGIGGVTTCLLLNDLNLFVVKIYFVVKHFQ